MLITLRSQRVHSLFTISSFLVETFIISNEKDVLEKKWLLDFNPLTPISDQDRISPYRINIISTRK